MELFFQWIVVICLPLITVFLIAIWNIADSRIYGRVLREIRDELKKKMNMTISCIGRINE